MIPLIYFLLAWLVALCFFGIMSLISVLQMVRLGIAGTGTYLSTATFLIVSTIVILAVGSYLITVDWQQTTNLFGWLQTSTYFNP